MSPGDGLIPRSPPCRPLTATETYGAEPAEEGSSRQGKQDVRRCPCGRKLPVEMSMEPLSMEPGQSRLRGGDAGRRDDSLARMAAGGGGFGVITPVVRARLQRSVALRPWSGGGGVGDGTGAVGLDSHHKLRGENRNQVQ
ncbi:predicted protein [Chaetomium globosum CBS 148.51]|uniref:Uncharacterized protein n=1 Tax=Chaetomium globosum (strain ATCC 6205 / CBS 148.51 / DSM 1962 / NBRC 6347 / NRRL 1970) TaxID=306901 RepID=Q2HHI4_CHAGB|nr:uncharacterized protein CHGG_00320 [Chaetomium globosum CBS 148.51]EAQ92085.1 predicted protein [Chaetomium globosum CBS 148.51]